MKPFRGPLYLSGPMSATGRADHNYPEFYRVSGLLESMGLTVVNPAVIGEWAPDGMPWEWYMRHALKMLLECEAIVMLPGWEDSTGATIEKELAAELKMEVFEWTEIETSHNGHVTSSSNGTTDSVSGAATSVGTGITDEPAVSEGSIATVHVTGLPSAAHAIRGYIRLVEQRPDGKD